MRAGSSLTWLLLLSLGLAALLVGCTPPASPPSAEMRSLVQADITQVMSDIDAAIQSDPRVGMSSNPFDYVGISPAFSRLVERGKPALEAIAIEIETSEENGLREYLLALAGNGILGAEERYTFWDNGKRWAALYRADHPK